MQLDQLGPAGAYHTHLLAPEDLGDLQSLFERAADYFEIATGRAPAGDEAQRAFVAGPPTKSVKEKRVIGIFRQQELVGVLDALTDWPAEGVWTLGMLLLDPAVRGDGLGGATLAAYEAWAQGQGAQSHRTAVVAHHAPGLRFLERAGFQREQTMPDYDAGGRRAEVVFLVKSGGNASSRPAPFPSLPL